MEVRLTMRQTFCLIKSDVQRMCDLWQMEMTATRACLLAFYPPILALIVHRWSRYFYVKRLRFIARFLWCVNVYVTGADINPDAEIGDSFLLAHPVGTVIGRARIGRNVTVYGQAGIGGGGRRAKQGDDDSPTIGDHVLIGVRAVIMGPITIGDHASIGACSLVLHDVPAHMTVAGVPARILEKTASLARSGE